MLRYYSDVVNKSQPKLRNLLLIGNCIHIPTGCIQFYGSDSAIHTAIIDTLNTHYLGDT